MTERSEYWRISNRVLDAFLSDPPPDPRDFVLRTTSGTTSSSKESAIVFALLDQREPPGILREWYWGSERTLICYGNVAVRLASSIAQFHDPRADKRILTIDAQDLSERITPLLADFKPDRLIGFPSFIARVASFIDVETAAGVTTLRSVGEALGNDLKEMLLTVFPNATFGTIYHMSELGPVSLDQCGKIPLSYFHPYPGVTVDIEAPDEHGIGDILITTDLFGGVHVEQYRSGDIGRIHAEPCPCGETKTFEVLGRRGYDFIKLAGALLVKAEFDRVLSAFPEISDYRVEASQDARGRGMLLIRLSSARALPTEDLRREIERKISQQLFLTQSQTLADLVAADAFVPASIEWMDAPFAPMAKPVKLKRV